MEGLWWLLLIVFVLLFGKNIPVISNFVSGFDQPNAVPTPDGLPAVTIQNQNSPPENQPAPWKSICATSPVTVATSVDNPLNIPARGTPITRSQA